MTDSRIHDNAGNGIKAKFLDGKWPFFNRGYTFCNLADIGSQQYPVIMVGVPTDISNACSRVSRLKVILLLWFVRERDGVY